MPKVSSAFNKCRMKWFYYRFIFFPFLWAYNYERKYQKFSENTSNIGATWSTFGEGLPLLHQSRTVRLPIALIWKGVLLRQVSQFNWAYSVLEAISDEMFSCPRMRCITWRPWRHDTMRTGNHSHDTSEKSLIKPGRVFSKGKPFVVVVVFQLIF